MSQNVFRMFVVGLLFTLVSYQPSLGGIPAFGNWLIGAVIIACAFVAWVIESMSSRDSAT